MMEWATYVAHMGKMKNSFKILVRKLKGGDHLVVYLHMNGRAVLKRALKKSCFEAFTAAMFQVEVFWVVTSCSVVVGYQCFRGPYYLHLQGEVTASGKKIA
jgi:hypothetical protein